MFGACDSAPSSLHLAQFSEEPIQGGGGSGFKYDRAVVIGNTRRIGEIIERN